MPIDPHVLATPILADLNNDFRVEELVIPVSYFYEEDDYRVKEKLKTLGGLEFSDIDKYLVAGITVLNLTTGQTIWNKLLDLTQVMLSLLFCTVPVVLFTTPSSFCTFTFCHLGSKCMTISNFSRSR